MNFKGPGAFKTLLLPQSPSALLPSYHRQKDSNFDSRGGYLHIELHFRRENGVYKGGCWGFFCIPFLLSRKGMGK